MGVDQPDLLRLIGTCCPNSGALTDNGRRRFIASIGMGWALGLPSCAERRPARRAHSRLRQPLGGFDAEHAGSPDVSTGG